MSDSAAVAAVELADTFAPRRVLESQLLRQGPVWNLLTETVDLGAAGIVTRELLHHPGAVAVLALDAEEQVLMIQQYRHPVRSELWEIPAGLLDVPGEDPVTAARRELAEETDLRADRWDLLVDWFASPGGSDEAVRMFLARDVHPVPTDQVHQRTGEELGMVTRWVPLDLARDAVLAGRIHNPASVVGILAACAARELDWATLRPVDSPWPEHHAYR